MNTLITGWFSFPQMGATAGDVMARDLVRKWLAAAGSQVTVAVAPPFQDGVDWRSVDPEPFTHLVFVCGPIGDDVTTRELFGRFAHCRKLGINLTMLRSLDEWNPFDLLWERDSDRTERPDITFACRTGRVPIVGVVLVKPQHEYGKRMRHALAKEKIYDVLAERRAAPVLIDTRLDENYSGLQTPEQVESLIARMDLVMTTRLHGTVLSLKNGVPPIAIDPILGGAKVGQQARAISWPYAFEAETARHEELLRAFDHCLTGPARSEAKECAARAAATVEHMGAELITLLRAGEQPR